MQIALAQLNYTVGDFDGNTNKIIATINEAKSEGVQLVVFSELCICGYPPLDFLEFEDFITRCEKAVQAIANACTNIVAIVGSPVRNPVVEGKNLYNAALVLSEGKITHTSYKALLPTYDVFDEYRYFEPAKKFDCVSIHGIKIALTICEDLWNLYDDPLYTIYPMDELIKHQPALMINIAASPYDRHHAQERKQILTKNVARYQLPLVYVNQCGVNTELIFDGASLAFDHRGNVIAALPSFKEKCTTIKFDSSTGNISAHEAITPISETEEDIYQALIIGIQDYFYKQGFKKAILGLSGGIDSALVTVLAAHALGSENVKVLMMPSSFSSEHSITDSEILVQQLGVQSEIVPIKAIYDSFLHTLAPSFQNLPFNVAEENLQARIRGVLLMAQSNKFGSILLNTSNKSEAAVGYGTLYGDMCGGLSVIGDLYKTEVYQLCNYINLKYGLIPKNIITKPPSAELRPGQKDSDSLPDYAILDQILRLYIEDRCSRETIIEKGFEPTLVQRVLKLVNSNEYKRYQTPPMLRLSSKAFGLGRRMPIVGKYLYQ
jgi:NAD+ synthase (glutamine-hydrolysing)